MEQIADDVHLIALAPRYGINAYLVGDVLVDSGVKGSAKKILAELDAARVSLAAHVITHAHVDHVGATPKIVDATGVPVCVGALDRAAAETGDPPVAAALDKPGLRTVAGFLGSFDGFVVDATIGEGDDIGYGFTVLDTPGHSAGHVAFWRESDRVLICGDVFNTMNLVTTRPGLQQPPSIFTPDPRRNRESERRLADLEPRIVLAGHGPPLRNAAAALRSFVAALPAD
ncbi:MBL fold metallo-hydrolase [Paraconexibacter sp.]|uniref:MBL fold metallo-hydrolase n=1 Tax=Paraconexibacter sp. TaxID=2949640 RepID=UPI0035654D9D